MLAATQIQRIYGMGAVLGIVEGNNKDDMLHCLVSDITGSTSIKQLSDEQYKAVVSELAQRIKTSSLQPPPHPTKAKRTKRYEAVAGGVTEGQQRKIWYLMYQLQACDTKPCTSSLGERLCGIIKKELKVDAIPKKPLQWLDYKAGNKLIEILKNYCRSAERKIMRGG